MPNDCWNNLTITCIQNKFTIEEDAAELTTLVTNELQHRLNDEPNRMKQRGRRGVICSIWSANEPDFEWLKSLLTKYPNCWIKNEWNEEGGSAGVWVGYVKNNEPFIKELEWDDISIEGHYYLFME